MPGKAGLVGLSLWIVSPIGDILDRSLGEVGIPVGFRYLGGGGKYMVHSLRIMPRVRPNGRQNP